MAKLTNIFKKLNFLISQIEKKKKTNLSVVGEIETSQQHMLLNIQILFSFQIEPFPWITKKIIGTLCCHKKCVFIICSSHHSSSQPAKI